MSSNKRHRLSVSSQSSSSPPRSTAKATRIILEDPNTSVSPSGSPSSKRNSHKDTHGPGSTVCTLPPTCNPPHHTPTALANAKDFESHYAMFHANVCEDPGCGCVFPDARLLELHQTECHDPIATLRKERGEKIFACFLPTATCNRKFLTPKTRRLHLVQAHAYPKEYFFSVTNKGVGGLLEKWGEGASLIRREWKPRDAPKVVVGGVKGGKEREGGNGDRMDEDESSSDEEDNEEESSEEEGSDQEMAEISKPTSPPTSKPLARPRSRSHSPTPTLPTRKAKDELDSLANQLTSLSLVPTSIRFGRGGRGGGFGFGRSAQSNVGGRGGGAGHRATVVDTGNQMEVDQPAKGSQKPKELGRAAGRGGRGTAINVASVVKSS